jgi:hypothetical protein
MLQQVTGVVKNVEFGAELKPNCADVYRKPL